MSAVSPFSSGFLIFLIAVLSEAATVGTSRWVAVS